MMVRFIKYKLREVTDVFISFSFTAANNNNIEKSLITLIKKIMITNAFTVKTALSCSTKKMKT